MNDASIDARDASTAAPQAIAGRTTVMQVLPSLETGGVERGTVDMTAAITAAGWNAIVVSSGGPMVREVERAGGTHVVLPVHSKSAFVMRANVRRLANLIRAHDVDIVHARSRAPAWSARAAARRTRRHFITTFHGAYNARSLFKRYYNSVMVRGERVIAISQFIGDMVTSDYRADPARVAVIHRGIDTAIFNADAVSPERMIQFARKWHLADGMPVIMLPGRLTRWKGHTVLIDALARLDRRDVRCLLVGSDQGRTDYRRELERRVKRAGLSEIVQFVGDCRDMPAAYINADVVVSASIEAEAFGRVAAEAQAMGKPVIATDLGAARETVIEGETGLLVRPKDPGALAKALEHVLSLSSQDRELLATRAVTHVRDNFTREAMCAKTLAIYEEVLRGDMPQSHASAA